MREEDSRRFVGMVGIGDRGFGIGNQESDRKGKKDEGTV
jgi:hypothetical protein